MKAIPSGAAVPIENPPGKLGGNSLGFFGRAVSVWLSSSILIAVFALSAAGAFAQAPTITTQPVSQSVSVGGNVIFSVVAIGPGQLSYQWLLNNTPITGATSATLNVTNVQSANSGAYTVIVANAVGVITSNPATLVVLQTPIISSSTSANGYVGISFQYQITASNSPTAFVTTALPAGLALGPSGLIAGIPMTTGTYTVGLTGTNAIGTGIGFSLTIVISPTPGMVFSSLVGDGSGNAGSADGTGSAATFNQPNGLATDILGNLYVADTGNSTIRKVSPSGIVTTFAGSAGQSGNADSTGTNARFSNPCGVAVDGSGNVYVADTGNHTIRKISPAGSVSTLAGLSGQAGSSDGSGSTARFNTPSGIAVDALNNVYVADSGNNTIRVITSGGVVRTLAGLAGQSGNLDAFGIGARFNYPTGIVVDPAGNIYVLDSNNQSARKVSPQGSVSTIAAASTSNQGLALGVLKPQNIFQGIALDNSINCFAVFCVTYKWGPSAYSSDTTLVEITPTGATSTINEWLYNFLVYGGILGDSGDKERGMALDQFNRLYLVEGNVIYQRALVTGPSIATQPQSQTVNAGQSVTFTVAANGSPLPTYQWQKNGTAISGATSATLMLGNAQTADAGNYSVIVSTGYGAVTSAAATLTVNVPPTITTQPQSQVVPVGVNVTFAVNASGTAPLSYQWKKGAIALANGGNISGATSATLTLANVQLADAGNYSVVVTNAVGNLTSNATTLTVYVPTSAPTSQFVTPGSSVVFAVTTSGPGSPTYQWELNGAAIAGATNATYTVANAQSGNMGFYSVTVSNGAGSVDSAVAILTVSGGSSRLMSLSARGYIQTGGDLTPGIALRGTGTKTLLIRAVGPTLSGFGVNGPLSDPKLDVIPFGATTPVVSNDDWGTNANVAALRVAMAAVGAFPLVEGSKDAAVLTTTATPNLAGNNLYTVRITPGGTATSGIVLTEVYDTEGATAPVKLVALSTRGFTSPNDNVLTSGFWIVGDGSKQLLIRAVGPTLGTAPYNVPGVLADPQFAVIPFGRNFTVASNDNWGGTAELQAAFAQTNDFALPTNSRDAAAIVRLPPGGYTVQATGVGDTTGNVLVEIYDMDP